MPSDDSIMQPTITTIPWARATAIIRSASRSEPHLASLMLMPPTLPARRGMSDATRQLSSTTTGRSPAAAGDLPVVVDESCLVASDIPRLAGKVGGINIKLAKCGSLREALRMIAVARAHGMVVMVGCMIESSLGITAAAHFTPLVDYADLDGAALTVDDPFAGATIDGGQIRLPVEPGLGVKRRE